MTPNEDPNAPVDREPLVEQNINDAPPLPFGVDDKGFEEILKRISALPPDERAKIWLTLLTPEILDDFKKFAHRIAYNAPTTSASVWQALCLKLTAMLVDAGLNPVDKWPRVLGFVGYCHDIMRTHVLDSFPKPNAPKRVPIPILDDDGAAIDFDDSAQIDPQKFAEIKDLAKFADNWMKEHLPRYQYVVFQARAIGELSFSDIASLPELADYNFNEHQVRYQYRLASGRVAAAMDGR